jgi:hypothetical protein
MEETAKSIKDRKLSKYILLGEKKIKVFRPKQIVKLHDEAQIYGDIRLKEESFDQKTVDAFRDSVLLMLKSKVKGQRYYLQQLPKKYFDDSRMQRLAGAILFEQNFKEDGVQSEVSFMKSELELDIDLPYEALKEKFLTSNSPKLMIADINRAIQVWEQQSR